MHRSPPVCTILALSGRRPRIFGTCDATGRRSISGGISRNGGGGGGGGGRRAHYKGMSVEMSAPWPSRDSVHPGSRTSMRGQGRGFLRQKSRKSKAKDLGTATKLACTNPAAWPLVGPLCDPSLTLFLRRSEPSGSIDCPPLSLSPLLPQIILWRRRSEEENHVPRTALWTHGQGWAPE